MSATLNMALRRVILATAGAAFGARGEGMVRVPLAPSEDAIVAGLRRLREATRGGAR
jgi:bifunctional pyridoxal-dependent enzyme with beta-cystathionase and maltose regulon repressor activities